MQTVFDRMMEQMEKEVKDKRIQQTDCGEQTFAILNAYIQGVQVGQGIVRECSKPQKMTYGNDNGRQRKRCSSCGCFVLPGASFCSKCGHGLDWD